MDIRQLEMFRAVAEHSSFTVAGRRLGVAQSAVSRQIRLLEEELGERLFKRVNKRVFLTAAGDVMLGSARRVFQELRNATLEISEISHMNRGTIRIGSGMTACMYLLPPVIERFQAQYPKIEIQVVTGPAESLIPQISNSLLDLGVLTLPVSSPDLEVIPFTTEEMVVVASPKNARLRARRSMRAAELAGYPMILFRRGTTTRALVDDHMARLGLSLRIVMESESVATIKPLVQIGLGIALLPLRAVLPEAQRGELHYLHLRDHKLYREVGLVFHRAEYRPKALEELLRLFRRSE